MVDYLLVNLSKSYKFVIKVSQSLDIIQKCIYYEKKEGVL